LGAKIEDLFLDIITNDYIKIIKAIERKKEIKGFNDNGPRRYNVYNTKIE
jgi:hypothetical protein